MPNSNYILTLTSEIGDSGPYYEVTYTSGAIFQPVVAGSPAYLPNVGSTAIVTIPSASYSYLAFKLRGGDNGCDLCYNESVVLVITGSAPTFNCCTGSILSTQQSGSLVKITYNSGTGGTCLPCNYVTFQTSSNGFDYGGDKTGTCGVSQSVTFNLPTASCPANTTYYRAYQTCTTDTGTTTSSYWVTSSFTSATASTCCTPSITSIEPANAETSSLYVYFATGSGGCCLACASMSIVSSSDAIIYSAATTVGCGSSPFTVNAPEAGSTFYFKIKQTCSGSVTSSFSTVEAYTKPSGQTLFSFGNCGRGNGVSEACSDATNNNRTFYSDCDTSTFGVGCTVYVDAAGTTPLTGYVDVFMNGANWRLVDTTGIVLIYSEIQC